MSIILPHTDLDIPFFRSDGRCYQRTQQGVALTPNESWENMAAPSDFGIHGSCEACHNAILTPSACPCTTTTWSQLHIEGSTPCGDPEDLCHRVYICTASSYSAGACNAEVAWDHTQWTGQLLARNETFRCGEWDWNSAGTLRLPGTNKAVNGYELKLTSSGWYFLLYYTPSYQELWAGYKTYGNSPEGVYERVSGCIIVPTAITIVPQLP